MLILYAAVSRVEQFSKMLGSEEGISPIEALKMYTLNGAWAWASDEQAVKGKIAPGLLANFPEQVRILLEDRQVSVGHLMS